MLFLMPDGKRTIEGQPVEKLTRKQIAMVKALARIPKEKRQLLCRLVENWAADLNTDEPRHHQSLIKQVAAARAS
jgi:hypothetical protein